MPESRRFKRASDLVHKFSMDIIMKRRAELKEKKVYIRTIRRKRRRRRRRRRRGRKRRRRGSRRWKIVVSIGAGGGHSHSVIREKEEVLGFH